MKQDIRNTVKERYGHIATAKDSGSDGCGCGCGPAESGCARVATATLPGRHENRAWFTRPWSASAVARAASLATTLT